MKFQIYLAALNAVLNREDSFYEMGYFVTQFTPLIGSFTDPECYSEHQNV